MANSENVQVRTEVYFTSSSTQQTSSQQYSTQAQYIEEPWWINRPQAASILAVTLLFISAGLHFAISIGWSSYGIDENTHFSICWLIAVIVGAFGAAPLIGLLQKQQYVWLSAVLIIIDGILLIIFPQNLVPLVIARYMNGIAYGMALVSFIVHASEIAGKRYRGFCLAHEQVGLAVGILIQVIISTQVLNLNWNMGLSPARLQGILDVVLGAAAIGASFLIIESPIYHLRQHEDADAFECVRRLQRPCVVTHETRSWFEDQRMFVLDQENVDLTEGLLMGLLPFLKLAFYRTIVAISFSLPLTVAVIVGSVFGGKNDLPSDWVLELFAVLRLGGALLALWLLDGLGRKLVSMIALIFEVAMLIGLTIIFNDGLNMVKETPMAWVCTFSLLYQFFAGMFVPGSSVYLGEAYPLLVKPYLVAATLLVENAIQIIIVCIFVKDSIGSHDVYLYMLIAAILTILFFVVFTTTLPETRSTRLPEAYERMREPVNLKFY